MVSEVTVEQRASTITVELTTDEAYIKSVFLNPTIYAQMKDDTSPIEPSAYAGLPMEALPAGFFLCVLMDAMPVGCFWLVWRNSKVEAHTALLPACRGRAAIEATKTAIRWVFARTSAEAITSYAWSDSPAVAWFCRAVGMNKTETKPWSATRNGKAVDISYYIINRGEAV